MVPRAGAVPVDDASPVAGGAEPPSPEVEAFVRFCYGRRRVGWPDLYDEMCAVAGRGLFRGWGPDEFAEHGIGFSLFELTTLAAIAKRIVAEDRAAVRAGAASSGVVAAVVATG